MRTSGLLPEECREEIRAHMNACREALDVAIKNIDFEAADDAAQWVYALAWVLGDDDS